MAYFIKDVLVFGIKPDVARFVFTHIETERVGLDCKYLVVKDFIPFVIFSKFKRSLTFPRSKNTIICLVIYQCISCCRVVEQFNVIGFELTVLFVTKAIHPSRILGEKNPIFYRFCHTETNEDKKCHSN